MACLAAALYWGYGYYNLKKGTNITFGDYINKSFAVEKDAISQTVYKKFGVVTDLISNEDLVKKTAIDELSEVIAIYAEENGKLPTKAELTTIYKDNKNLLTDSSFIYATSTDGKQFDVSIKLKNGTIFKKSL
ncbi:MAG: hypothetical protein WCG01_01350 [bacterium]